MRGSSTTIVVLSLCISGCNEPDPEAALAQDIRVCASGPTIKGIDVSYHEPNIDWSRVRADGVDFAFIRATDGLGLIDPKFASYWDAARDAGIIRGAYQFFRPQQDPIEQAELILELMGPLQPGDLPPVIDVEADDGVPPAELAAKVQIWIDHVTARLGRAPIIYAGLYSWEELTGNADFRTSPLWVAQWGPTCPNIPSPWQDWMFWQYAEDGWVDGIDEGVDVNWYDGTRDDLLAFAVGGSCGDAACNAGETPATCATDCAPCGVVPAAGGVIDDGDACFATGGPPDFLRSVSDSGHADDLIWTHTTADAVAYNFADWWLFFAEAGRYRVEVYTAAAHAHSTSARYRITTADDVSTVVLDQTAVDGWQTLGDFDFAASGHQSIHLGDNTGESGAADIELAFDAIRLTRLDPLPPPPDDDDDDDDSAAGGCSTSSANTLGLALVLAAILRYSRRRQRD